MKKIPYILTTLILFLFYSITTWLNPLAFTYLKLGLIGFGLLIVLWLYRIFSRRRRIYPIHKIILVLTLVLSSMNLYIYININKVLNPIQLETTQISVFVLKENEDLKFTKNLKVGLSLELNPALNESLSSYIKSDLGFTFTPELEDNDQALINALYDEEIPAIMIDVANLGFLDNEVAEEFISKTTIIYTIEESIEVEDRDPIIKDFDSNAIVFYISGIDYEGSLSTRARSDVNQLAIVNPDTREISLVSIPRDSYVPTTCLDGVKDKLTHAGVRGIQCSISTIEQYLQIPIDYYVRLNFTSFISIFDIIGPLEIYSYYTFSSHGFDYVKGLNLMDSDKALMFARSRKDVPGGDLTRGLHQQEVIKAVFKKLTSPSQIGNIQKVINSTRRFVQTDMIPSTITELLDLFASNATGWGIKSYILEGTPDWAPWPNDPKNLYSVIVHSPQQLIEYRKLMDDLIRIPER